MNGFYETYTLLLINDILLQMIVPRARPRINSHQKPKVQESKNRKDVPLRCRRNEIHGHGAVCGLEAFHTLQTTRIAIEAKYELITSPGKKAGDA